MIRERVLGCPVICDKVRSTMRLTPLPGCPAPLLPSPGLRSDPAQCNKSSPKDALTQTLKAPHLAKHDSDASVSMSIGERLLP